MESFLSKQQIKVILEQAPKNADHGRIVQALADKGYKLEGFNDQPVVEQPGAIKGAFQSGVNQVKEGYNQAKNATNPIQLLEGGTKAAAGIVNTASAPLAPIGKVLEKPINAAADKLSNLYGEDVQRGLAENGPTTAERVLEDVGNVATVAGAVAGVKGAPAIATKTTNVVSDAVKSLTLQSEKQIEDAITSNFNKGIKPSIAGKNNPAAIKQYNNNVLSAVKTIKENAPNLTFIDDLGETITGQTPKSLQQLTDSIEQTKKTIFTQYDSLAKQAGEAGVKINMKPIANELDTVINNKALSITNPKAIQYAEGVKERLLQSGELDAITAQEVVQNYNKSLEAFYRNPSYDTASQVSIDALLANRVREALDEGISGLTGEQYSALKKQYGALKSVEKDVVKATLRDARKSTKGLIDFGDILSGGQVVNGIVSLNPGQLASGLTQKAITEFYKYLNNPNRAIEKMFKAADQTPGVPIPNKQGGFVNFGGKTTKAIDKATKSELESAIDYIRMKKPTNQIMEEDIGRLAEKFGITAKDLPTVARKFEDLITKTKNR